MAGAKAEKPAAESSMPQQQEEDIWRGSDEGLALRSGAGEFGGVVGLGVRMACWKVRRTIGLPV